MNRSGSEMSMQSNSSSNWGAYGVCRETERQGDRATERQRQTAIDRDRDRGRERDRETERNFAEKPAATGAHTVCV